MEIDLHRIDFGTLPSRIFRVCGTVPEVVRVMREEQIPAAEAWESLAAHDAIPMDWVDALNRRFVHSHPCESCQGHRPPDGSRCTHCDGRGEQYTLEAEPPSLTLCAALASDLQSVRAAEQLGLELVHRLRVWDGPVVTRVAWRLVDPETWRHNDQSRINDVSRLAAKTVRDVVDINPKVGPVSNAAFRNMQFNFWGFPLWRSERYGIGQLIENAACWEHAAKGNLELGHGLHLPSAVRGSNFGRLANPFAPQTFLWATGFAFDTLINDTIILAAPPPTGWPMIDQ